MVNLFIFLLLYSHSLVDCDPSFIQIKQVGENDGGFLPQILIVQSEANIDEVIKFINWKNNKTIKEIKNMSMEKDNTIIKFKSLS